MPNIWTMNKQLLEIAFGFPIKYLFHFFKKKPLMGQLQKMIDYPSEV